MNIHINRRRFIQSSAMALAGQWAALHLPFFLQNPPVKHLGLQLWSVRDDMKRDASGTIAALAKMGYREVEGFGFKEGKIFDMPFSAFLKLLKDNGIAIRTTHFDLSLKDLNQDGKALSDRAKKAIDDLANAGLRYAVCPWISEAERSQPEKIVQLCQLAGAHAKKSGIQFAYHNHDFEFKIKGDDGRMLYEWLLQEVDPAAMVMEMDLYWVKYAGLEPVEWFRRYPGRFKLCHVKDMAKTPERQTVEVGDGSIDFASIFKERKLAGLQYFIVELEHYATTPMQGVKRARENFLRLKF